MPAGLPRGELRKSIPFVFCAASRTTERLSLDSHRREFQAWELGTWSSALERHFRERTETSPDGTVRYRPQAEGWQEAFVADVNAGRYYETAITHPALFLVAQDLDHERIIRFPADLQRELQPMATAIATVRAEQIAAYQKNGPHVRVVWLEKASHYLFVDQASQVAARMLGFLDEASR